MKHVLDQRASIEEQKIPCVTTLENMVEQSKGLGTTNFVLPKFKVPFRRDSNNNPLF